jgi:holliday junction DNA helicase RuvA
MIREIRGTVLSIEPLGAVIDVHGIGIFVHLADTSALSEGKSARLLTHLAIKQDGIDLYGFTKVEDRHFFELSLHVPGVGPKTALSLLRRAPREKIEEAIAKRDTQYLTRVVGLGKKSAEKLIMEMSERVSVLGNDATEEDAEIFDTLVALGYTEREARSAVMHIPQSVTGKEARLRAALSSGTKP